MVLAHFKFKASKKIKEGGQRKLKQENYLIGEDYDLHL
jgi:hypothetical protein